MIVERIRHGQRTTRKILRESGRIIPIWSADNGRWRLAISTPQDNSADCFTIELSELEVRELLRFLVRTDAARQLHLGLQAASADISANQALRGYADDIPRRYSGSSYPSDTMRR